MLYYIVILIIFCCSCSVKYVTVDHLPNKEIYKSWPYKKFTKEAWNNSSIEKRYIYFNNLRERKLLKGLSKDEVIDLLGKPCYNSMDECGSYFTYIIDLFFFYLNC